MAPNTAAEACCFSDESSEMCFWVLLLWAAGASGLTQRQRPGLCEETFRGRKTNACRIGRFPAALNWLKPARTGITQERQKEKKNVWQGNRADKEWAAEKNTSMFAAVKSWKVREGMFGATMVVVMVIKLHMLIVLLFLSPYTVDKRK